MMSTTNKLTQAEKEKFLDVNRDLLALTTNGPNDIFKRISASLALNSEEQANVIFYANEEVLNQRGFAGQVAREDFSKSMYAAICRSFLRIQRNGVVTFAVKVSSPEAQEQQENIEIAAGEREPRPVVPPPPPPKSAKEQLEDEVIADYNGALSTEKMRKKMNSDVVYRETFNRLSDSGRLQSRITTYTDASGEFRQ
jgi:hypothetical protein